jgi:hypothetical protein
MGWVVKATPGPIYPRYQLYRRMSEAQVRCERVWKISHTPGFYLRTMQQPVASRYTG